MIPRQGTFSAPWGWLPALLLLFATSAQAQLVLQQSDGSELALPSPPKRVITLAPNLAEMMFEAGAGDLLVATVEYSNFPAQAAALPRVGDAFRFDLERLLAFQPDLVIGWTSGNPSAALERIESLGVKVWRVEMRSPEEIVTLLEDLVRLSDSGQAGLEAVGRAREKLTRLSETYQGRSVIRYFYQVAERPLFTLNGEHIVSQGLSLCGGQNVFADGPVIAPQVSVEAVLVADPDVLIAPVLDDQPDPLLQWRDWPRLKAVRNDALVYLPADQISQATSRMLDSLALACKLLDQFRDQGQEE
jgi:iron complex transport system substrate-binding protein